MEVVRTDRLPAMGDGVGTFAVFHSIWCSRGTIDTHEGISGGIEGSDFLVGVESSVVVSSFSVFGFVIDGRSDDFHFTGRIVSLEVGGIILRIPQTEFNEGEQIEFLLNLIFIVNSDSHQKDIVIFRYVEFLFDFNFVFAADDGGVAQTMVTLVMIEFCLCRLPARIPDGVFILYIYMEAILIQRQIVVSVAGDPS